MKNMSKLEIGETTIYVQGTKRFFVERINDEVKC